MPRAATGSLYVAAGRIYARVPLGRGRKSFALPTCGVNDREKASERALLLARLAKQLSAADLGGLAPRILEKAASRDGDALAAVLEAARALVTGEATVVLPRTIIDKRFPPAIQWPSAPGVYFVRMGDRIKIGRAANVNTRLRGLQTGSPTRLELLAVASGGEDVEVTYHQTFGHLRVLGEWFCPGDEIMAEIDRLRACGGTA